MQELGQAHRKLEEVRIEGACWDQQVLVRFSWTHHHYYLSSLPSTDTPAELALVKEMAITGGADAAIVSNHWAEGGAGARELAAAVIASCETPSEFKFLYDLALPIEEKITTICKEIYGADGIELSDLARTQIDTYTRQGFNGLPSESRVPSGPHFQPIECLDPIAFSLHGQDPIFILTRCLT